MRKEIFCSPCTEHGIEVRTLKLAPEEIIESVCKYFKVDYLKVIGKDRYRNLADARHISMHLLRNDLFLNLSLCEIGKFFNKKDHTTIMHAIKKIENISYTNNFFREQLQEIYLFVYKTLRYYPKK